MIEDKSIEKINKAAFYIEEKIGGNVDTAIILGTGLGNILDKMEEKIEIKYEDVPNFLISTNKDHPGKFVYGSLNKKKVLALAGRFHYYEGYDFSELAFPIYVLKKVGVKNLIITNAAGAISYNIEPGDIVLINDHINLVGAAPTRGNNLDEFGDRFFPIDNLYDRDFRKLAQESALELGFALKEGTYYYATGPHFETPAEIRAMRILGGDMVGMSTVPEALAAGHCNIKVLCLSVATNYSTDRAFGMDGSEVVDVALEVAPRLKSLIERFIEKI